MLDKLKIAIAQSDMSRSREIIAALFSEDKAAPWNVHQDIYPEVQLVLNPPFKNPHLAKMYAINGEIAAYLRDEEKIQLVKLEVQEYARRPKLEPYEIPSSLPKISDFTDVEKAIADNDPVVTATAMAAFMEIQGRNQFARRLLLLGSGYLDSSLGHSISCTVFILLEMIKRHDQSPWPALLLLADYFCKGAFTTTPELQSSTIKNSEEIYREQMYRAVSGTGIVALHHTITAYAIERCSHLVTTREHDHLLAMWIAMMTGKKENIHRSTTNEEAELTNFTDFYQLLVEKDPQRLLPLIADALPSPDERYHLARNICKAVMQLHNGDYNPHYLTGLGSSLWLMETFHQHPELVITGWLQYLDYFLSAID